MRRHGPFLLFILALTAWRLAFSGWFDLIADEAYYWLWSQHLSAGYYDHPPMVAWFIALSSLLGESERLIRLMAVISSSAITCLVYALVSDMFTSRRTGFGAALLLNLTPIFGLGSTLITPDAPMLLFWTAALYSGYRLIDTQRPEWWYAVGLFFGLAILSKYSAVLFAPALLAFLIFSIENRHWLFRREPYLAFALGALMFSPALYWGYTHDWMSFKYQLSHGFTPEHARQPLLSFAEFWIGQVGFTGGPLFFFILAGAVGIGWIGVRDRRDDFLYLSFFSAGPLLFFLVNSLQTKMEEYWSVMAYVAAVAATPGFVTWVARRVSGRKGVLLRAGYAASLALSAIFIVYAHSYMLSPSLATPFDKTIGRRLYGWSGVGNAAGHKLEQMKPGSFVISSRRHSADLLRYYIPGRPEVFMIGGVKGRFEWFGSPDRLIGKDALYVSEKSRVTLDIFQNSFERVEPAGEYTVVRGQTFIHAFRFFRCYNYRGGLVVF